MPEPVESPPLTDKEEAKWRAEFEQMGREAVRHAVHFHPGNLNPRHKLALALRWLREKETEQEARERHTERVAGRTFVAAVVAAILTAIGIVVIIVSH
jgi:hypothetical protein